MEVVVELVESKKEEIIEKITDQIKDKKDEIVKKADDVLDNSETVVEKSVEEVGKKIEEVAKPILDLIESNPQIASIIDSVVDQVNGREISCSCWGFLWSLHITRKTHHNLPSKFEETQNKLKSQPALNIRTPV